MRSSRSLVHAAAVAALALLAVTCKDTTTGPGARGARPDVGPIDTADITLTYLCGNSFAVQNAGAAAAVLRYAVDGVVDSGTVTLPPRPGDAPYSETYVTAKSAGPLVLYHDTLAVRRAENGGASCPAQARLGEWSAPFPWPVVALHLSLLPNGALLTWGHDDDPYLWDPSTGAFTLQPSETHLFCAGHSFLPDGRLFITGGHISNSHGLPDANLYDGGTFTRVTDMALGRWYPTNTTLANGAVLTTAGKDQDGIEVAIPEVWQADGTWRRLTGASRRFPYYPRTFVAPNGKVFYAGEQIRSRYLTLTGAGSWGSTVATTKHPYDRNYGSAVMYEAGKILIVGGGGQSGGSLPTQTAEVIDINKSAPAWRFVGKMSYRRRHLNATILPTGDVLVTGGTSASGFNNPAGAVYAAERWSPKTEQWTTLASNSVLRIYHSTALLLPDGRVLGAGGGDADGAEDQLNGEIYSPPYLFKPDGSPARRPTIVAAPERVAYGATFAVETPDGASIRQARWIRLGSTTHGFDQNQRANTLPVAASSGGVAVTAPASANLAPPGHYLLFLVDHNGVPSVGKVVRVG